MTFKKKNNIVTFRLTDNELEQIRLTGMTKTEFVRSKIGFNDTKEKRLSEFIQRFFDEISTAKQDISNLNNFINNISEQVSNIENLLVDHAEKCDSSIAEYDQLGKVVIYLLSTVLLTNQEAVKALKTDSTKHVYDYAVNLLRQNSPFENIN